MTVHSLPQPAVGTDAVVLTSTERALDGAVPLLELRVVPPGVDHGPVGQLDRAGPLPRRADRSGLGRRAGEPSERVIETHRSPVDLDAIRAALEAQRFLASAGSLCAAPLAGPDEVDGPVRTTKTLIVGRTPDGRDPASRRMLTGGLGRHIALLSQRPDLVHEVGPGVMVP